MGMGIGIGMSSVLMNNNMNMGSMGIGMGGMNTMHMNGMNPGFGAGIGMGMGMGGMVPAAGRAPGSFPQQPGMPMPPPPPSSSASGAGPQIIGDPTNDASCWAEHESPESGGQKYWYNRVTQVSTYDKPLCLKTPEERSIPPCAWKEYTSPADGKKYYSNGAEST